jgi:hypothetical protein
VILVRGSTRRIWAVAYVIAFIDEVSGEDPIAGLDSGARNLPKRAD